MAGLQTGLVSFDVLVRRQSVSVSDPEGIAKEVAEARAEFREINARNREFLSPLIDDYLAAYDAVLCEVEQAHRLVCDDHDLDLLGPSRDAATWLVAGRCIGLARAAFDLVRHGYTSEALPTIRSLHEACCLLDVFALRGEDELVARWIEGRSISRREIMRASERQQQAIRTEMLRAGEQPPSLTGRYFNGQYGRWSEFAHHRRRHVVDQVAEAPRMMALGSHPDWRARAATVDHLGDSLSGLVSAGGLALSKPLGPAWFHRRFQPTLRALFELKRKFR